MTYRRSMVCARWVFMVLAGSLVAEDAAAQFPASQTDRRVRLHFADAAKPALVGQFIEFRHDSALVRLDDRADVTSIPAADLRRMERWSRRGHMAAGATTGAVVGAFSGVVAGLSEESCSPEAWFCYSPGFYAVMYGATGLLLGGVVGGVVGALIRTEGWTEMPLPTRVVLAPVGGARMAIHATVPIGGGR